jgi:ribosomal protein S18 acetylase RimI-like enzyme
VSVHSRDFSGPSDLPLLIQFASRTTRRRLPGMGYYHPGDITWQLYNAPANDFVRLWLDGERVVAFGVYEAPLNFQFELDPDIDSADGVFREVLAWVEDLRRRTPDPELVPIAYRMLGTGTLSVEVLDADQARSAFLGVAGYRPIDRGSTRFEVSLETPLPDVPLPPRSVLRHATDADVAERAELHRDAWSVWGQSPFSERRYRRLRASPGYDEELDVVLEYEGRLVSYCVCWADAGSGVGYFEPVGTRPSAAGMGFGRAVITEGLRRLRERGMSIARTATASVNDPAQSLYRSAGFRPAAEQRFYTKGVV